MPAIGWYAPAPHTKHEFTRLVSTSDTGRAIYGCRADRCGETEIRGVDERSPYAIAQAQKAIKKAERKRDAAMKEEDGWAPDR